VFYTQRKGTYVSVPCVLSCPKVERRLR
jgi:hypothetical protein